MSLLLVLPPAREPGELVGAVVVHAGGAAAGAVGQFTR
jgi:hypothetical protein